MKIKYLKFSIYITKFLEILAIQEVASRGLVDALDLKWFPQVLCIWQITWLPDSALHLYKETVLIKESKEASALPIHLCCREAVDIFIEKLG